MADIQLSQQDIDALKAKVSSMTDEQRKEKFFELRKRQKIQQMKQAKNADKHRAYQLKVQEERRILTEMAKAQGWDKEISEKAKVAAEEELSAAVETSDEEEEETALA